MTIVVGVDGSRESKEALRWAAEEARLRETPLEAVCVWAFPYGATGFGWMPTFDPEIVDDVRKAARCVVRDAVAEVVGTDSDVKVSETVVEGAPASVLLEKAAEAELLVMGSRGLGGFKELLLGSVSHQCSQHASCPVVIVRGPSSD